MLSTSLTVLAAGIPSPDVSFFELGPLRIHFYALFITAGIVLATVITNHRLTKRGAEPWIVIDIGIFAVPLAFVFARVWHVVTHLDFYFGAGSNPWNPFEFGSVWAIWEGGIAIFGALFGGALGAYLGCRWSGVRFWTFADAVVPGLILAQALGRLGNYFNQELFGGPTDLPWGLQIDADNPAIPAGLAADTLFHPTFLYELLWNLLGFFVLLWLGRKLFFQWGRLLAVYLIWYSAGRIVWENIRVDPSEVIFGLRSNVWAAIFAIVVAVVIFAVQRRHLGAEPSPYVPGRGDQSGKALQSQEAADEYVDISAPPTVASEQHAAATSTTAAE